MMSKTVIECQALGKRYGGTQALQDVTLELAAGGPIALVGPNGAGKTTLISLICGFIARSSGQMRILGEPAGAASLTGRLAALPQDALLDPRLSIARQLTFLARLQGMSARGARDDVQRVLELVDLAQTARSLPVDLSHGMRKRIAIAQALLGTPELVLLDEPTAGIDPPNARKIRELIHAQSGDTTFVVSSHNLDELERLCRTVVYLEKGRLISVSPVVDDGQHSVITLRLADVPEQAFLESAATLPAVQSVVRNTQGDYRLQTDDAMQASQALLQLLAERHWDYRMISRGQSLEERLYGDSTAG